jgi:hypothetical protein
MNPQVRLSNPDPPGLWRTVGVVAEQLGFGSGQSLLGAEIKAANSARAKATSNQVTSASDLHTPGRKPTQQKNLIRQLHWWC